VTPPPDALGFVEQTSTSTSTTSTTLPPPTTCRTPDYDVSVPGGWHNHECRLFSAQPFEPDLSVDTASEIELLVSTNETYAQVLAHIESTATVLRQQSVTVDGLTGRQFVQFESRQERVVVVLDAGDAVVVASANMVGSIGDVDELSIVDHFAQTKARFAELLRTIEFAPRTSTSCAAPDLIEPELRAIVDADLDADGDLETLRLLHDGAHTVIAIDGVGSGTVWGRLVKAPNLTIDNIGWRDLDLDGVAEIFYRIDGSPARAQYSVRVLDGCAAVPVVDGVGVPVVFESFAFGERGHEFVCVFDDTGALTAVEQTRTLLRTSDRSVLRAEETSSTYASGVLRAGATRVSEPSVDAQGATLVDGSGSDAAGDGAALDGTAPETVEPAVGIHSCGLAGGF